MQKEILKPEAREKTLAELKLSDKTESLSKHCLLYTSDAADDLHCVDLGGRRIIKNKRK